MHQLVSKHIGVAFCKEENRMIPNPFLAVETRFQSCYHGFGYDFVIVFGRDVLKCRQADDPTTYAREES
jgi:hypothetical protein